MSLNRKSAAFLPFCVAAGGFALSAALFGALSLRPGPAPGPAASVAVQDDVPTGQESIEAAQTLPPAKAFLEIVTRPIFAPDRRPTAAQELAIETISSELELRLIGVVVASGSPIAIVAQRDGDTYARVTVGDRFQGWTVVQIEPHRVTFRRDQAVERLELSYDLPPTRRRAAKVLQTGKKETQTNQSE